MSYLIKKKIKGNPYYYIVDSERIHGNPKHVNQIYLGPVEEVIEKLKIIHDLQPPLYSKDLEFGNVASLYDVAQRLGVIELIDKIAGKREQGITTGTYLLIVAINRAVAPTSKAQLEDWFTKTILSKLIPIEKNQLSSPRFWDNMNRWTDEKIQEFETEFIRTIMKEYKISSKCLIYDATNFFTYINTSNTKAQIPKRGHSKEKRNDLRIVGLSLLVSQEEEFPLFYEVYEGNVPDVRQFEAAVKNLKKRYQEVFGQEADITLVFDRGNNSESNIGLLDSEKDMFHYVGGLRRSQCTELFSIPKAEYSSLEADELGGTTCYRTRKKVFGKEMTIVMTNNPELVKGQLQGIFHYICKCTQQLMEFQEILLQWRNGIKKKGRKPTKPNAEQKINHILSEEYMKDLFVIEWTEDENYPYFNYSVPEECLQQLEERELGKSILFTDQHEWSNEKIVKAYRGAWRIEKAFRQMKDTDHLAVRPIWHWTDQKIKVHIFCCILAFRLCCILQKELKDMGIHMSINKMLDKLAEKKQYVHYYQQKRGLKEAYSMTMCDDITEKMVEAQGLHKYQLKVR